MAENLDHQQQQQRQSSSNVDADSLMNNVNVVNAELRQNSSERKIISRRSHRRHDDDDDDNDNDFDDDDGHDDEATLEEEERMQNDLDIQEELAALQYESAIPIENLLPVYYLNKENKGEISSSSDGRGRRPPRRCQKRRRICLDDDGGGESKNEQLENEAEFDSTNVVVVQSSTTPFEKSSFVGQISQETHNENQVDKYQSNQFGNKIQNGKESEEDYEAEEEDNDDEDDDDDDDDDDEEDNDDYYDDSEEKGQNLIETSSGDTSVKCSASTSKIIENVEDYEDDYEDLRFLITGHSSHTHAKRHSAAQIHPGHFDSAGDNFLSHHFDSSNTNISINRISTVNNNNNHGESFSADESDDKDYVPSETVELWKKETRIGEEFQAQIQSDVELEPNLDVYLDRSIMIFDGVRFFHNDKNDDSILDEYLENFRIKSQNEELRSQTFYPNRPPPTLNDELAFERLHENGYNVEEALNTLNFEEYETWTKRRPNYGWSGQEISGFEQLLQKNGKNFHLIARYLVTKSVQQIVQYYYYWKSSPLYDRFASQLELLYFQNIRYMTQIREKQQSNVDQQANFDPSETVVPNYFHSSSSPCPNPGPFRIYYRLDGKPKIRWIPPRQQQQQQQQQQQSVALVQSNAEMTNAVVHQQAYTQHYAINDDDARGDDVVDVPEHHWHTKSSIEDSDAHRLHDLKDTILQEQEEQKQHLKQLAASQA